MKVLSVALKKMEGVEQAQDSIQRQAEGHKAEFDSKLAELNQALNGTIDGLRKETRRELDAIKDAKD